MTLLAHCGSGGDVVQLVIRQIVVMVVCNVRERKKMSTHRRSSDISKVRMLRLCPTCKKVGQVFIPDKKQGVHGGQVLMWTHLLLGGTCCWEELCFNALHGESV